MLRLLIKEEAEKQKLNRNQLQLRSGVTLPLLTRYWNNHTTEIRLDALEKIAKALRVEPGALIIREEVLMQDMKRYQALMRTDAEEEAA